MIHTFDKEDIDRGFVQQYIGKPVIIEKYPDYYVLFLGILNKEGHEDDRFITSGGIVDKITTTAVEKIGLEWPEKLDKPVLFKAFAGNNVPYNHNKWSKCICFNDELTEDTVEEKLFRVNSARAFIAQETLDETVPVFIGIEDNRYNSCLCWR